MWCQSDISDLIFLILKKKNRQIIHFTGCQHPTNFVLQKNQISLSSPDTEFGQSKISLASNWTYFKLNLTPGTNTSWFLMTKKYNNDKLVDMINNEYFTQM